MVNRLPWFDETRCKRAEWAHSRIGEDGVTRTGGVGIGIEAENMETPAN